MRPLPPVLVLISLTFAAPVRAQGVSGHAHTPGMTHEPAAAAAPAAPAVPGQPGQSAYAAIAEIAELLKADPRTDWSKVDLEALRQHLVDMDEVTMRSAIATRAVPGGIVAEVTGVGRTAEAIRRIARAHGATLTGESAYRMTVEEIAGGVRATIVASASAPDGTAARIRGLGFIGILVDGSHHTAHHLAIAKGEGAHAHQH